MDQSSQHLTQELEEKVSHLASPSGGVSAKETTAVVLLLVVMRRSSGKKVAKLGRAVVKLEASRSEAIAELSIVVMAASVDPATPTGNLGRVKLQGRVVVGVLVTFLLDRRGWQAFADPPVVQDVTTNGRG